MPAPTLPYGSYERETGVLKVSGEGPVVSGQWSVSRASQCLMTWLHLLTDCTETEEMLNVWIKQLATIH